MDELLQSGFELRTTFEDGSYWCELFTKGISIFGEHDGATRAEAEAALVAKSEEAFKQIADSWPQPKAVQP